MLATRLGELEATGVLIRLHLRHNTRAYALIERGLALREAIDALEPWGAGAGPRRLPRGSPTRHLRWHACVATQWRSTPDARPMSPTSR